MIKNFIFGYGSLMESGTRKATGADDHYLQPARLNGYIRGWLVKQLSGNTENIFLGTAPALRFPALQPVVNGILYEVDPSQLSNTDELESNGYTRTLLSRTQIEMIDRTLSVPSGRIWIYLAADINDTLTETTQRKTYPILQSYLATCLKGCEETEARFACAEGFEKEFIERTCFWERCAAV